jgi:hypothetical protein
MRPLNWTWITTRETFSWIGIVTQTGEKQDTHLPFREKMRWENERKKEIKKKKTGPKTRIDILLEKRRCKEKTRKETENRSRWKSLENKEDLRLDSLMSYHSVFLPSSLTLLKRLSKIIIRSTHSSKKTTKRMIWSFNQFLSIYLSASRSLEVLLPIVYTLLQISSLEERRNPTMMSKILVFFILTFIFVFFPWWSSLFFKVDLQFAHKLLAFSSCISFLLKIICSFFC